MRRGKAKDATALAVSIGDPVAAKLIEWASLRHADSQAGFDRFDIAVRAPGPVAVAPPPAAPQSAQYCREYQQTVVIGGQMQQAVGTTCQQADGTWKDADGDPVLP